MDVWKSSGCPVDKSEVAVCNCHLDDIVLFSHRRDELIHHDRQVFSLILEAGVTLF